MAEPMEKKLEPNRDTEAGFSPRDLLRLYEPQAPLHFCNWLAQRKYDSFWKSLVEWDSDLEELQGCCWERPLEDEWYKLTLDLRKRVCNKTMGGMRFPMQDYDASGWRQTMDEFFWRMRCYNHLHLEQKNVVMDKYFPDKNVCTKPPEFPLNLHLVRTKDRDTASVIASMSPNNWSAWERLLLSMTTPLMLCEPWQFSDAAALMLDETNYHGTRNIRSWAYWHGARLPLLDTAPRWPSVLWSEKPLCGMCEQGSGVMVYNFIGREELRCLTCASKTQLQNVCVHPAEWFLMSKDEYVKTMVV